MIQNSLTRKRRIYWMKTPRNICRLNISCLRQSLQAICHVHIAEDLIRRRWGSPESVVTYPICAAHFPYLSFDRSITRRFRWSRLLMRTEEALSRGRESCQRTILHMFVEGVTLREVSSFHMPNRCSERKRRREHWSISTLVLHDERMYWCLRVDEVMKGPSSS